MRKKGGLKGCLREESGGSLARAAAAPELWRPPAPSRSSETNAGACPRGRWAPGCEGWRLWGRLRGAVWGALGLAAPVATPRPRSSEVNAQRTAVLEKTRLSKVQRRVRRGVSPRCRVGNFPRKEGSWAKRLRLPQRGRCKENQKIKCPLPGE